MQAGKVIFLTAGLVVGGVIVAKAAGALNDKAAGDLTKWTPTWLSINKNDVNLSSISGHLNVEAVNPTANDLTLERSFFDIYLSGKKIGSVNNSDLNQTALAKQVSQLQIPFSFSTLSLASVLGSEIFTAIATKDWASLIPSEASIKGNLEANGHSVDFNKTIKIRS